MAVESTGAVNTASSAAVANTATAESTSKNSLDYNAFLQLLVAQLKNQDPTEPMDPTQYMAQLASFSNVEQAIKTNSKLDTLNSSLALAQADGVIGRTVTSQDGTVSGQVASVRIVTGGAVATLTNGKTLQLGPGITVS